MTFQDARQKQLAKLDDAYDGVRKIVSDPAWCNEAFKPYQSAIENFAQTIQAIMRLNSCDNEASR